MTMLNPPTTATIIPRRSIGPFNATVTIEEIASDDLEISSHPVQGGGSIADHAFLKPAVVKISFLFNAENGPLIETYSKLRKLQSGREPFDVVTGKRAYKNMLMKTLSQTNDANTENVLSISVELQEVFLVGVEKTTVPPRKNQKMAGKTGATEIAGKKSAQPATAKNDAALIILYDAALSILPKK